MLNNTVKVKTLKGAKNFMQNNNYIKAGEKI